LSHEKQQKRATIKIFSYYLVILSKSKIYKSGKPTEEKVGDTHETKDQRDDLLFIFSGRNTIFNLTPITNP